MYCFISNNLEILTQESHCVSCGSVNSIKGVETEDDSMFSLFDNVDISSVCTAGSVISRELISEDVALELMLLVVSSDCKGEQAIIRATTRTKTMAKAVQISETTLIFEFCKITTSRKDFVIYSVSFFRARKNPPFRGRIFLSSKLDTLIF